MNYWNHIWNLKASESSNEDIINGFGGQVENTYKSDDLFKYLIKTYNIKKNESILEFGCGSGRIGQYFINEGYKYYGIDKSINMINLFKSNNNNNNMCIDNIICVDNNKLPFENNSIDIIICYSVVQYLSNLTEFKNLLDEFIRVSKKLIYIGDIETIDHTNNNKKHYKYKYELNHLTISKDFITDLTMNYKINIHNNFCTRTSRYNCILELM